MTSVKWEIKEITNAYKRVTYRAYVENLIENEMVQIYGAHGLPDFKTKEDAFKYIEYAAGVHCDEKVIDSGEIEITEPE